MSTPSKVESSTILPLPWRKIPSSVTSSTRTGPLGKATSFNANHTGLYVSKTKRLSGFAHAAKSNPYKDQAFTVQNDQFDSSVCAKYNSNGAKLYHQKSVKNIAYNGQYIYKLKKSKAPKAYDLLKTAVKNMRTNLGFLVL